MATSTANCVAQASTTGTIRPHVAFVEALLTAAGWVQTADTGQTASASFPAATGTLTVAGYQIWRMNDALQGTAPVFVKIEFGSGSVTNSLGMWFTIGTGSNGTGTITGIIGGNRFSVASQGQSATLFPCYGSGSTSRLSALHCYTTATVQVSMAWGIERTKDAAGADTNAGVIFNSVVGAPGTLQGHQYLPFAGTVRAAQTNPTIPIGSAALGTLVDGANVGLLPIFPMAQIGPLEQGLNFAIYFGTDIAANTDISATVKGSARTYKTFGTPFSWGAANQNYTSSCFAMRYE